MSHKELKPGWTWKVWLPGPHSLPPLWSLLLIVLCQLASGECFLHVTNCANHFMYRIPLKIQWVILLSLFNRWENWGSRLHSWGTAWPQCEPCQSYAKAFAFNSASTQKMTKGGAWVAQSVRHPTSAQVMISRSVGPSPTSGSVLTALKH